MTIDAAELYINVSANNDFNDNIINPKSSVVNINCNHANSCTNNLIQQNNIDTSITFSCNGDYVDCANSTIYCSTHPSASCKVECSSCPNTKVHTRNGIRNLQWKCSNTSISCYNSKLFCGGSDQNEYNTILLFNSSQNRWNYQDPTLCITPG